MAEEWSIFTLAVAKENGAVYLAVAGLPGMAGKSVLSAELLMPTSVILRSQTAKHVMRLSAGAILGNLTRTRTLTTAPNIGLHRRLKCLTNR